MCLFIYFEREVYDKRTHDFGLNGIVLLLFELKECMRLEDKTFLSLLLTWGQEEDELLFFLWYAMCLRIIGCCEIWIFALFLQMWPLSLLQPYSNFFNSILIYFPYLFLTIFLSFCLRLVFGLGPFRVYFFFAPLCFYLPDFIYLLYVLLF